MAIVFAGPSLTREDRAAFAGVEWRPPAAAGDLLRLHAPPHLPICLIDGYFDHRPAVRHKELLLLLSQGSIVLGASSIGALRAAEMRAFGMIGIGAIYRAYAGGRILRDDEVALVHGPEEWDWRPLSVPLVDCRAVVHRAFRASNLSAGEARALISAAGQIHYVERDWPAVLAQSGLSPPRRAAFESWRESAAWSQKRADAVACIEAALRRGFVAPPRPQLVRTTFLQQLADECGVDLPGPAPEPA